VSRKRVILVSALAGAVILIWGFTRKRAPPEVPFAKATRETIVSSLSTNGKVEPIEWASARAERSGVVQKVFVARGQQVSKDAPLVQLDVSAANSQLATAAAEIAQAQAQEQVIQQGGPQLTRTQIEAELATARASLANAQKEHEALQRLVAKQAAPRQELETVRQRVEQIQLQIHALEQRRAALVSPTDLPVAKAKLNEAESTAVLARRSLAQSIIRAPIAGTVYQFDLRLGAFVNPGDLVANVGRLEQVRVSVYVDEPDLGKVSIGMPVTITWDAMPGRQWKGVVDKLPTQVVPLGTRQVGEVGCMIDNPDRDLLAGTNINAEIQSRVVQNALIIPTAALHREGGTTSVFQLSGDRVIWRQIKVGVTSYTKAQVLQGLSDGDSVALPTDKPLKNGMRVASAYP
jgi:HlyD family secretion protein